MESSRQQVREIIEKLTPNLSPEDRAQQEALLSEVVDEGKLLKDVLNVSDDTIEYLYSQAYRLYKTGKYKDSSRYFHILYMLNGLDLRFTMGIAACHHMQKEYQKAVEWYFVCAALDENSPLPYYHISDCFLKMEENLSALIALKMLEARITDEPQFAQIKEKSMRMIAKLSEEMEDHRIAEQLKIEKEPAQQKEEAKTE
ncbi:Type III secretion specific chlamydia chaperone 2 [Chlamydiales bacterium STE3]|nr:Type III secretion specific chlamydia chaperone 2 [Chlamydiales bacterium STE3]